MIKRELKKRYFEVIDVKSLPKDSKEYHKALKELRILSPYIVEYLRKGNAEDEITYQKKYKLWFRLCFAFLIMMLAAIAFCFIVDAVFHNETALYISLIFVGLFLLLSILCVPFANHLVGKYLRYLVEHFEPDQQGLSDEEIKEIIAVNNSKLYAVDEPDKIGCYNCLRIFSADTAFLTEPEQLLCPYCFSAKVMDESVHPITEDFLLHTHRFWMEDVETAWQPDENAIEVIKGNDDFMIEVFKELNAFTYKIWHKRHEDYGDKCFIYWSPLDNGTKSLFDTKEKAIEASKEMLQ